MKFRLKAKLQTNMISKDEFRKAMSCFATGVTVVTTKDSEGNFHGLTVSAFCSVSLEPLLILICVDKLAGSHNWIEETGSFVVNILSDKQRHISERFASPVHDRFEGVDHFKNGSNIPILKDALVNLECKLKNACDGGDHTIFIGEIENVIISDGKPLIYFQSNYRGII